MRLGVFGGTFDPVHYGHLLLAESCREQLTLDEVWFLPTAIPPHKRSRELTAAEARAEMLQLAVGGHAPFRVSRYEIDRGGVNYTVDTLGALARQQPASELFFLMGADSLRDLPTWKEPARICELATIVVVERADPREGAAVSSEADLRALAVALSADAIATIDDHRVRMPRIDISSSDIRRRVAEARSIRYQTPRAVEAYIAAHGLYK
jgi:nicotinate-nucleotide adenylyltransferase